MTKTEIHHGIVIRAIIPESNRKEVDELLQQLKAKSVIGYFELIQRSIESIPEKKHD